MAGRPTSEQVVGWAGELAAVAGRIGRRFARSEPRRRAVGYVRGLLSDAERKNGWQLAERLGDRTPDGVQHLLARADWDADAVRDDLLAYVAEYLGHPDGVLIVDESGFLKKGSASIELVESGNGLKLRDHVGTRVSVTGTLTDRQMRVQSVRRAAPSCS